MFNILNEECEKAPIIPKSPNNCTLVSLLPYAIKELKPLIIPGYFQIPPARGDNIQALPIGESIHWMESPYKGTPPIKMTETSKAVARSIVNDFIEGQLAVDSDAAPGLFYVEGHFDEEEIVKHFKPELNRARKLQKNWFVALVRIAEDDWARARQHNAISDIQRHAARYLGMNVQWLDITTESMQKPCPLCSELVRADAIVHSTCGFILDVDRYNAMKGRIISKDVAAQLASIGVKP